jgi:hypothetical protein
MVAVMRLVAAENSAPAIWERTLEPGKSDLDPAAARALARLKFSRADLDRADKLAHKARQGRLTSEEHRELEDYRSVGAALEFLKSKARISLRKANR